LGPEAKRLLEAKLAAGELSARGVHRVWRVLATLRDLRDEGGPVTEEQALAALALRAEVAPSSMRAA
jgi:predicted ATPase with chaperone activity